jgi:hypothetical protein
VITPAAPEIPERFRRYLGVWGGTWNGDACGSVAVTDVQPDGSVTVVYAWDPKLGANDENPKHLTGQIDTEGELSIRLLPWQTEVAYRFSSPEILTGRYYRNGMWDIDMVKVAGPEVGG